MKVYIVTEYTESMIRFATLNKELAVQICNTFPQLGLKINEVELIGLEK